MTVGGDKLHAMTSKQRSQTSKSNSWHPAWVALLGSLWLATAGNYALWQQVHQLTEVKGFRGLGFAIGFGVMIIAALTTLLSLFNWGKFLKPVLTVFFLSAASGAAP